MCGLGKLPERLYIASFFFTQDGYLVTVRTKGKFDKNRDFIGFPKQIKKILLKKNAEAGKLGVNYHVWPWHKKIMAHLRIITCRLRHQTFSSRQVCEN